MSASVASKQRHTRGNPCQICDGHKDMPQGKGIRCAGFDSDDGEYCYCTREEWAGSLDLNYKAEPPAYAHKLHGPCRCGATHGAGEPGKGPHRPVRPDEPCPVHPELGVPDRVFAAIDSATGKTQALHCRWDLDAGEKTYRWHRNGRWTLGDVRPVDLPLYGLPGLKHVSAVATVVLTEGEPAARALLDHGIPAVSSYGADVIPSLETLVLLRGHQVVLWADKSETGISSMRQVGAKLDMLGIAARLFTLADDFPAEADAVDYFAAGMSGEQARALLAGLFSAQADALTWDEPAPLPDGLPPVALFDMALLPAALRGWVWDVAERMQVPPDFPAVAALVSLAAVVGRQVGIYPKRYDDWLVVPNLWGALVGRPSVMKTPALEAGLKPLDRLVAEATQEHQQSVADYDAKLLIYEAQLVAHKAALKQAAKDGDDAALSRLAASPPEKPVLPVARRYSTNDATVEKIGELLIENPIGLLQFRDELVGWLRNLDKPGREGDRAFFLESFGGMRGYEIDRIGRGSLSVPAVCLSLLGGIQPGPLASYVYAAASDDNAGNDGLLQRFQLLVWPDEPVTWRNVDRYPNTEAKNAAYAVYKRLATLDTAALGAVRPDGEPGAVPALRFTAEAQAVFDAWHERLERRLRSGEMSAPLESHLAKYRSLMPSLALLSHLADSAPDDTAGVGVEAAVRACAWCDDYLESHARRLYAHAEDPSIERARALLEHIQAGDVKDGTPVYHILRHHWSRLTESDELTSAITTLETFSWVQVQRLSGGRGRPSDVLRIHPSLVDAQERRAAA
jgi:hypothetical protein